MAAANDELKSKMESEPNFSADIEQIDEQSPYIQMVCCLLFKCQVIQTLIFFCSVNIVKTGSNLHLYTVHYTLNNHVLMFLSLSSR